MTHRLKRMNLWLPRKREVERNREGVWDGHVHSAILKMDNQQGLYSTGNSAQCSVAAWMGGEHGWLSPFVVHLKLSQHCLLINCTPNTK